MNKLIYREGFTIFFGRVKSSRDNERRSKNNLQGLLQLGIDEELGGRESCKSFYLYRDNNLDSIPEITTLITKIYPQKETL